MAITLAEAKVGMADHVDQQVIDEFRKQSAILSVLQFDNSVSPGTGGSTLTYGYMKLKTPSVAKFRKLNEEYTKGEAKRERASADLKVFGGAFGVDRVLANTSGAVDEMAFQLEEKVKGAVNLFHQTMINGNATANIDEFDGLDTMLKGTETEYIPDASIDLSTSTLVTTNAQIFDDIFTEFVATMSVKPDMFLMNSKMKTKMRAVAVRLGYLTSSEDAFGNQVEGWNGIPFVDLEDYYDGTSTKPIIGIDATGETSIYAVKFGLDAFHGASPLGDEIIKTYVKDETDTGVILDGEVEAVMAVVLKNSKKAAVLRKVKVTP